MALFVSGIQAPTTTDATLYEVQRQSLSVTNEVLARTAESSDTLKAILEVEATKPKLFKSRAADEPSPIQSALQTLVGDPAQYVSLTDLLGYGHFPPDSGGHNINEPYLSSIKIATDLTATNGIQALGKMDQILSKMDSGGSSAIVALLAQILDVLTQVLAKFDVSLSQLGNKLTSINDELATINTKLEHHSVVFDEVFYTPLPYSDMVSSGAMYCRKQRVPLVNLLLRALYAPQHAYTYNSGGIDRIDYTFVPYLSTSALANDTGTGDNQFAPQVNKTDPYAPGDLFSAVAQPENVFSRLIDPTIQKSLENVDWRVRPDFVYKRK